MPVSDQPRGRIGDAGSDDLAVEVEHAPCAVPTAVPRGGRADNCVGSDRYGGFAEGWSLSGLFHLRHRPQGWLRRTAEG